VHEVLVYLTIDGEELTTTPEHPFLQAGGAWTPASKLVVGNQLRRAECKQRQHLRSTPGFDALSSGCC